MVAQIENSANKTEAQPKKDNYNLTESQKEPIKDETWKKLSKEFQELAQMLTPEKFTNELETLKNKDINWKESALASMISQLTYKWIAIEQITGAKSIKLYSTDWSHTSYERALNQAIESNIIKMSELQAAIIYQTSSLDEFIKTNSWNKKEWLQTTKYIEFIIDKYNLTEKWLKDKNGNINIWVINDNVTNVWDKEFLLTFFTSRSNNINVKFDNTIPERYNTSVLEKIKIINNNIPAESLKKIWIYPNKTEKLTADFTKDPMGTMMSTITENWWTWVILWILALLFWKWFKWFATWFLWGTALQTLWVDETTRLREQLAKSTANATSEWIDKFKEFQIDEKYKAIYNKILEKVKSSNNPNFTESDFATKFRDFSKSEDFKKCNITDLENNYNAATLDKFFNSKMEIAWKSSNDYLVWWTKNGYQAWEEIKKNKAFLWYILWEKESNDTGKTIEELFKTKDQVTIIKNKEEEKEFKLDKNSIIQEAWINIQIGTSIIGSLSGTSVETLENAQNKWDLEWLFKLIYMDSKTTFYSSNKTDIDKLVKTILWKVPNDKKDMKILEIFKA